MKKEAVALAGLAATLTAPFCLALERLVTNQTELLAAMQLSAPGDAVVLKNGIWSNLSINFQNLTGSPAAPVQIRAQTPGQVVIAGPNWSFDVGGNDYQVSGLTFKDENLNQKSIRIRGTGANFFDNAMLLGGQYHQVLFDARPNTLGQPSQFHHNFAAGKQDRGLIVQLDLSFQADVHHNYFGHRPQGGPSGNTNGWETIRIGTSSIMDSSLQADIRDNYFEATNGEAETISDKTHDNKIRNNTFRNITNGWVTARHGGNGVYEGNAFFSALGIRVGNSDDTIADHPNLTVRNNYIEGPNAKILLPGAQTQTTIDRNTIVVTAGAYNNAGYTTGKHGIEYNNTTSGTITGNLSWISDSTYAAMQARTLNSVAPSATGGGNIAHNAGSGPTFQSSTPTAIRNLFTTANPQLARDEYGFQRPTAAAAAGVGIGAMKTPAARNTDVGASWLDPVMRLNKFAPLELKFNGDYADAVTSPVAHNTGYLVTPATLRNAAGDAANLHSADATGVSGQPGDRAFDNRATTSMGNSSSGTAAVIDRQWFRGLEAFTITGWFKTDGTQTIGNGASLIEQFGPTGGWSLKAPTTGALTLSMNAGTTSTTRTAVSDGSFTAANEWTFFAVTFDARPSSNEVTFYTGSETTTVTPAGTRSINLSSSSDTVTSDLLIGKGFDGLLDNIRLFSARRTHTYVDDTLNSFTKNGNGQDYALLSLAELRTVRRTDMGIAIGDLNESRSIDAADIDLLFANLGNPSFDVDGDFDADYGDLDLLVFNILGTVPGDANLDRRVNLDDFTALAASFGGGGGWSNGDFNGSTTVNLDDFTALAANFGFDNSASGRGTVPEPAATLAAPLMLLLRRRR